MGVGVSASKGTGAAGAGVEATAPMASKQPPIEVTVSVCIRFVKAPLVSKERFAAGGVCLKAMARRCLVAGSSARRRSRFGQAWTQRPARRAPLAAERAPSACLYFSTDTTIAGQKASPQGYKEQAHRWFK